MHHKENIVYLNGAFISKKEACISPDDRGFYFADGIYEVIKYYKGKPFCFNDHMIRLKRSLNEVKISFDRFDMIEETAGKLISINKLEDEHAGIYIQITRGVHPRMHSFPEKSVCPTLYINAYPFPSIYDRLKHGIKVIMRNDIRWHRCDIKAIGLLPNVLMYQEAIENGAQECFFVREKYFTESTHSNIFAVSQGTVHTHPDSDLILSGITKKIVLQICRESGIAVDESPVYAEEYKYYDEFFISGTGSEVMPVVQIENTIVGDGKPGQVTRHIQHEFFTRTYGQLAGDWNFRNWIE
jgi:D-alanine transaminase